MKFCSSEWCPAKITSMDLTRSPKRISLYLVRTIKKLDCAQECKPLPRPKSQAKVIWDLNSDFWINLNPNPGLLPKRIHSLVCISHFAKYHENWLVTVWEILINLLKSPIPQWSGKWKVIRNPYSGPDHHQKLTSSFHRRTNHNTKFQEIDSLFLCNPTNRIMYRQTEWWTHSGGNEQKLSCSPTGYSMWNYHPLLVYWYTTLNFISLQMQIVNTVKWIKR